MKYSLPGSGKAPILKSMRMRYHKPGWAIIQTNRAPDVFQVYKQTDPDSRTYTLWPNMVQHNTINLFNTLGGAKKWLKQHD